MLPIRLYFRSSLTNSLALHSYVESVKFGFSVQRKCVHYCQRVNISTYCSLQIKSLIDTKAQIAAALTPNNTWIVPSSIRKRVLHWIVQGSEFFHFQSVLRKHCRLCILLVTLLSFPTLYRYNPILNVEIIIFMKRDTDIYYWAKLFWKSKRYRRIA